MEKPGWAIKLEGKILEISKSVTTCNQFWTSLIEYCNGTNIAISTPEKLQQEGNVVFMAQKTDEVGTPSSLQILRIKEEEFNNIS